MICFFSFHLFPFPLFNKPKHRPHRPHRLHTPLVQAPRQWCQVAAAEDEGAVLVLGALGVVWSPEGRGGGGVVCFLGWGVLVTFFGFWRWLFFVFCCFFCFGLWTFFFLGELVFLFGGVWCVFVGSSVVSFLLGLVLLGVTWVVWNGSLWLGVALSYLGFGVFELLIDFALIVVIEL